MAYDYARRVELARAKYGVSYGQFRTQQEHARARGIPAESFARTAKEHGLDKASALVKAAETRHAERQAGKKGGDVTRVEDLIDFDVEDMDLEPEWFYYG